VRLPDGLGHLTYSTLVHESDTWDDLWRSVTTFLPRVKARVSPAAPFGVSIRLSDATARTLVADPGERARLRDFLAAQDLYVFTANAFPYGPFKDRLVMERVYEPDWSTAERVRYTADVARILADITPAYVDPGIQTAPLAFRPNVSGEGYVDALTRGVLLVVSGLVDLERHTGRTVRLALEPEPACYLETTPETVRYFEDRLFSSTAARILAGMLRSTPAEAEAAARRHLGVVFDICHQSVQFEDIPAALGSLVAAGIPILKLQEAAALRIPRITDEVVHELRRFTDTIYLSQTTERREDGSLAQHLHLADAIEAYEARGGRGGGAAVEWRTHVHVPVFLDDLGLFGTTRSGIDEALVMHRRTPLSDHLEIETYTWDVLPARLKTGDIVDDVVRELEFVRGRLTGDLTAAG
jgi:hypothetical protein